jgi:hypothetical protein
VGEAGALIEAYKRVGVSSDTFSQALRMLERNIKTNGDAVVDMGRQVGVTISLHDDLITTYFNVVEALGRYREGHERNQAALAGFGARVQNVNALLRVHQADVADTTRHMKELGIELGDNSVAQARKFQSGMADVNLVLDAVKYRIGGEMLPVLIDLGVKFANLGPTIVQACNLAISGIEAFVKQLPGLRELIAALKIIEEFKAPDLSGVGGAAAAGAAAGGRGAAGKPTASGSAYEPFDKSKGGGGKDTQVAQWEKDLEDLKAHDKAFMDEEAALTKAFWAEHLATGETATKAEEDKLQAAIKAGATARLEAEKGFWTQRLADAGAGTDAYAQVEKKINELEQQINKQRLTGETDLIKSKIAANQELLKNQETTIATQTKLDEIALKSKEEALKNQQKLKQITDVEELTQYRALLAQEQAQEEKRAEQLRDSYAKDAVKFKEYCDKLVILKQENALKLQQIDDQIEQKGTNDWTKLTNSIQNQFKTVIGALTSGGKQMQNVLSTVFKDIMNDFMEMIESMIGKSGLIQGITKAFQGLMGGAGAGGGGAVGAAGGVAGGVAGAAGAATQTAAETTLTAALTACSVAITSLTVSITALVASMAGEIAALTANTTALMAAAFVPKPFGFLHGGIVPSAAGGWDVPGTTLALLHPREMVLPEDLAGGVRSMVDQGGGGGGDTHIHFNVSAIDHRGIEAWFRGNSSHIMKSVQAGQRKGLRTR